MGGLHDDYNVSLVATAENGIFDASHDLSPRPSQMGRELNARWICWLSKGAYIFEKQKHLPIWETGEGFCASVCRGMGVSLAEDYTAPRLCYT